MADEFPYSIELQGDLIEHGCDDADRHWYSLADDVKEWVNENCKHGTRISVAAISELVPIDHGWTVVGSKGFYLNFRDKADATKFKLFWC